MTPILRLSIAIMFTALGAYTIGVWSERFSEKLKLWHLAFFWLGFVADSIGTNLMGKIAGGISINLHSLTGIAAVLLMLIHALWATYVILQKDKETAAKFHKFSVMVWIIWLIPFISGLLLAML